MKFCVHHIESAPLKFSARQGMERAFHRLLQQFIDELKRPPPYGLSFDALKGSCINYCESYHHEVDFTDSISSISDLISKPKYCNFLNIRLLKCLATKNDCLKASISNYENTFNHVKIKKEIKGKGMTVKVTRAGL